MPATFLGVPATLRDAPRRLRDVFGGHCLCPCDVFGSGFGCFGRLCVFFKVLEGLRRLPQLFVGVEWLGGGGVLFFPVV